MQSRELDGGARMAPSGDVGGRCGECRRRVASGMEEVKWIRKEREGENKEKG